MNPHDFVEKYYPEAVKSYTATGIHPLATMAQAALETGWGQYAPGNALFGIKDTDGINGNEQLETTFEYSQSAVEKWGGRKIVSVEPVMMHGLRYYKYTIQDYFRKYNTPADSFTDHAQFFFKNGYYAAALVVKNDCNKFIDAISVHYSDSPDYATTLKSIARSINAIAIAAGINPIVPLQPITS